MSVSSEVCQQISYDFCDFRIWKIVQHIFMYLHKIYLLNFFHLQKILIFDSMKLIIPK